MSSPSMTRRASRSGGGAWGWSPAMSGSQDAVVDLGVEDREAEAVGGEGIQVAVRDAGDEAVAGQAREVVTGLVDGVGGAEQAGHQGAQALVRDAGDGAQHVGEGAGQGHDSRVAEP